MRKIFSLDTIFIFLFLVIFPFGQIIRIGILQPLDLIVGLGAVYSVIKKLKVPNFVKKLQSFLFFAAFSWFFSIFIFHRLDLIYGLLYLIRFLAYIYFGTYVANFIGKVQENKNLLINSLLIDSVVSSFFGWIQFFWFSDIKPFFIWGWDMHLFRLVGTFLDPTFLGLIIVFGLLIAIVRLMELKSGKLYYLVIILFLLLSLAFTYSRASYLAFAVGILTIIYLSKKFKKLALLIIILGAIALLLPTAKNHSIELTRTFSVIAKVENYQTTLKIFSKSPVIGVGYDNMCIAYQKYIGPQEFSSHACSGSDSSLLFILATTGVAGLIIFIFSLIRIFQNTKNYILFVSSSAALLVHSLFSNSLFYPWIMGWVVILTVIFTG